MTAVKVHRALEMLKATYAGGATLLAGLSLILLFKACILRIWHGPPWQFYGLGQLFDLVGLHGGSRLNRFPAAAVGLMLFLVMFDSPPPRPQPTAPKRVRTERRPMRMPRWLWVRERGDGSRWNVRLGRVIHWFALACAALVVALGVAFGLTFRAEDSPFTVFCACCFFALVVAVCGRGARYVIGNE